MWLLDRVKPNRKFEIDARFEIGVVRYKVNSMPHVGELAREDKGKIR